jgi:hypothetical protein
MASSREKAYRSRSDGSGHLVKRGVSDHIRVNTESPFDHAGEKFGDLGKAGFIVFFGVGAVFP